MILLLQLGRYRLWIGKSIGATKYRVALFKRDVDQNEGVHVWRATA